MKLKIVAVTGLPKDDDLMKILSTEEKALKYLYMQNILKNPLHSPCPLCGSDIGFKDALSLYQLEMQ